MIGDQHKALFHEYLLRLGDDNLILGHRLSEWCGHGPILEEDIALANIALDCLGQAVHLLRLAGEVEEKGRSEDDLAYFRETVEFRNAMIVELPKGDFAFTIVRQFLYDSYAYLLYRELQHNCAVEQLAAIAAKALKEITYHLRHSSEWVLRLGDGTEESHVRAQKALDELWMYTGEMFTLPKRLQPLVEGNCIPNPESLRPQWRENVDKIIAESTLALPEDGYMIGGSWDGRHSEHLGHLLAEMQILARSFPGAKW